MKHSRRRFIRHTAGALGASSLGSRLRAKAHTALISSIQVQTAWHGGGLPASLGWFHPRGCRVPSASGSGWSVLMTMQDVSGSDVFHQVHFTTSDDLGKTWTKPKPVPDLDWHDQGGGLFEGVCDVVPQWHSPTKTVLAMGHNVYYRDNKLTQPADARWPMYVVRGANGTWTKRRRLEWNEPRASAIYSCGCGERLWFDNGDLLVAVSFGPKGRAYRSVTTLRCAFDGTTLTVRESGSELANKAGRGLLEPSVTKFRGRYYLTIRAEDGKGYVSTSDNGLQWSEARAWAWEDGTPLVMSTTQTHWLPHVECLHLAYNRRTDENAKVMRFRSPLFVAEVDHETLRLRKSTERIVFPMEGDAANDPRSVPLMGNFHPLAASPDESWITVGENTLQSRTKGDLLIGRIRWSRPNALI